MQGNIAQALDEPLRALLAHGRVSEELRINPKAIRPCVAHMLKTGFKKGDVPDRSKISSILASEFVKIGFDSERIKHELLNWNKLNEPPLNQSAIVSTINTAIRNNYNYSCRYDALREFCIGYDLCPFSRGLSEARAINFRLFFTYHWQLILSNKAVLVYWVALPQ